MGAITLLFFILFFAIFFHFPGPVSRHRPQLRGLKYLLTELKELTMDRWTVKLRTVLSGNAGGFCRHGNRQLARTGEL